MPNGCYYCHSILTQLTFKNFTDLLDYKYSFNNIKEKQVYCKYIVTATMVVLIIIAFGSNAFPFFWV